MLKLYHHPLSTFSQRVRIALLEKQIPVELVEIDLLSRAQYRPDFLCKNPYARVPAIEENGLVVYESTAILEYLEATRPTPSLLPADARLKVVVAMHLKLCDLEFASPARIILLPKRFLPKENWRTERWEEAKAQIQKHLTILETQIEGKEFLVDNQFSLAEVCYAPFLQFLPTLEVEPGPATALWTERLLGRPSIRETKPAR